MKFFIAIGLCVIAAYAAGLYFPWWTIAVSTFIVSVIVAQKPLAAFLSGFIALFLLWLFMTLYINSANDGTLAPKVSLIMGFGPSASMLVLVTSILGGIVGGMGALTGSLLVRIVDRDRREEI